MITRLFPAFAFGLGMLLLLLAGCGNNNYLAPIPGVPLIVGTDTAPNSANMPASNVSPVRLNAPLDSMGSVVVYNFQTGQSMASGVVDANGFSSVRITAGSQVAVVAAGTRAGRKYILSTLVNVPLQSTPQTIIVDPVSSLTAEAIALFYFKQGITLALSDIAAVATQAQIFVASHPALNYSVGPDNLLHDTPFGAAGCLDASQLLALIAVVESIVI